MTMRRRLIVSPGQSALSQMLRQAATTIHAIAEVLPQRQSANSLIHQSDDLKEHPRSVPPQAGVIRDHGTTPGLHAARAVGQVQPSHPLGLPSQHQLEMKLLSRLAFIQL
jgi:hypothetical protein